VSVRLPGESLTYFVQGEKTGLIKIGVTWGNCPCHRIKAMQIGSPDLLSVLGVLIGNHEKKLHKQFLSMWSHGEWFQPDATLLDFINSETKKLTCDCLSTIGYQPRNAPGQTRRPENGGSAEQNRHNADHRGINVQECEYCQRRLRWTYQKVARTKKRLNSSRNSRIATIYGKKALAKQKVLDIESPM
jgi:hypothetical protein